MLKSKGILNSSVKVEFAGEHFNWIFLNEELMRRRKNGVPRVWTGIEARTGVIQAESPQVADGSYRDLQFKSKLFSGLTPDYFPIIFQAWHLVNVTHVLTTEFVNESMEMMAEHVTAARAIMAIVVNVSLFDRDF